MDLRPVFMTGDRAHHFDGRCWTHQYARDAPHGRPVWELDPDLSDDEVERACTDIARRR